MKVTAFVSLAFAALAFAGPLKRDCSQECYSATNECNMTYGGCWTRCASASNDVPTFTRPLCSPTPDPDGFTITLPAAVTEAPSPIPTAPSGIVLGGGNDTSTCTPLWICEDAATVCGKSTILYGACFDMCSSTSLSAPTCTEAPFTPTDTSTTTTPTKTKAAKTKKPCKAPAGKEWMCAPADW